VLAQLCAEVVEDDDSSCSDAVDSMAGSSSRRWPWDDNSYDSAALPLGVNSAMLRATSLSMRAATLALLCMALVVMSLSTTVSVGRPVGSSWQLDVSSGVLGLVNGMCHEKKSEGLLILVPCPTFMTLLRSRDYHGEPPPAAKADTPNVAAKVETWLIVFNGAVKVRSNPSFQAPVKRLTMKCNTFMGSLDDGWIKLQRHAGYIRQHIGDTQIAKTVHPGQVSADCPRTSSSTWTPPSTSTTLPKVTTTHGGSRNAPVTRHRKFRVVFNGRVKIRSKPSFQASINGRKWKCQIFFGEEDNGWIRLQGSSGFIRSHIGATKLVEELKVGVPPGSCAPLIRQWRIVFEGRVKIRKRPSVTAPVTGVKWKCAKFAGQMEDGWIKLTANAGYVKAGIGPTRLAEEVRAVGQKPCQPLTPHQRERLYA